MRAVVVYESMYGNTRAVAEAIGSGLRPAMEVDVLPVSRADADAMRNVDLLVLGGPTHVWGLPRPSTRKAAAEAAGKPDSELSVEPGATGPGLREWLDDLRCTPGRAAAFDTHLEAPLHLSGSAGRRIAHRLKRYGMRMSAPVQGFLVTKQNTLAEGELERARAFGERLAAADGAGADAPGPARGGAG